MRSKVTTLQYHKATVARWEKNMSITPKGVADHPAKDQMEQIWKNGGRAKEIVEFLEEQGLPIVSQRTIGRYGQRFWNEKIKINTSASEEELANLVETIESSGVGTITKIGFTKKKYPGWEKIDGENVQVEKESTAQVIEITPSQPFPFEKARLGSFSIKNNKELGKQKKPKGFKLAVVIPDPQIGYHRDVDGNLTTTHDEAVIDIIHQIQLDYEVEFGIDLTILLGDCLDFAAFSSHRSAPGYLINTQLEIDRYGTEVAIQRELAPNAEIVAFNGNHEDRLNKMIIDKLPALHGISKANTRNPVLSVSSLCDFDKYNIKSIDTYPDGEYWANDYLRFEHGSLIGAGLGATAAKYLHSARVSTVYGHIHRQELVFGKVMDRHGNRNIFAGSPGCSARIDGVLPSSSTGIGSDGKQLASKGEKWQHGMWVIWYEEDGLQRAYPEIITIENGFAINRGKVYTTKVNPNGKFING